MKPLHIPHHGNLPQTGHNRLQVLQVGYVENDVDYRLAVGGTCFDVANVGFRVADHARDQLQHAVSVITEDRKFDGIGAGRGFITGPGHVDAPLGLVHQVHYIGTTYGVNCHTLASRYVSHDRLATNGVATSGTVDQQVAGTFYDQRI